MKELSKVSHDTINFLKRFYLSPKLLDIGQPDENLGLINYIAGIFFLGESISGLVEILESTPYPILRGLLQSEHYELLGANYQKRLWKKDKANLRVRSRSIVINYDKIPNITRTALHNDEVYIEFNTSKCAYAINFCFQENKPF